MFQSQSRPQDTRMHTNILEWRDKVLTVEMAQWLNTLEKMPLENVEDHIISKGKRKLSTFLRGSFATDIERTCFLLSLKHEVFYKWIYLNSDPGGLPLIFSSGIAPEYKAAVLKKWMTGENTNQALCLTLKEVGAFSRDEIGWELYAYLSPIASFLNSCCINESTGAQALATPHAIHPVIAYLIQPHAPLPSDFFDAVLKQLCTLYSAYSNTQAYRERAQEDPIEFIHNLAAYRAKCNSALANSVNDFNQRFMTITDEDLAPLDELIRKYKKNSGSVFTLSKVKLEAWKLAFLTNLTAQIRNVRTGAVTINDPQLFMQNMLDSIQDSGFALHDIIADRTAAAIKPILIKLELNLQPLLTQGGHNMYPSITAGDNVHGRTSTVPRVL